MVDWCFETVKRCDEGATGLTGPTGDKRTEPIPKANRGSVGQQSVGALTNYSGLPVMPPGNGCLNVYTPRS